MKITIDAFARLNLHTLLGSQQGTVEEIEIPFDIRDKIKFDEETRQSMLTVLADGRAFPNDVRIKQEPDIEIELEKSEVAYLKKLLGTWKNFGVGDIAWIRPLKKQLDT